MFTILAGLTLLVIGALYTVCTLYLVEIKDKEGNSYGRYMGFTAPIAYSNCIVHAVPNSVRAYELVVQNNGRLFNSNIVQGKVGSMYFIHHKNCCKVR